MYIIFLESHNFLRGWGRGGVSACAGVRYVFACAYALILCETGGGLGRSWGGSCFLYQGDPRSYAQKRVSHWLH